MIVCFIVFQCCDFSNAGSICLNRKGGYIAIIACAPVGKNIRIRIQLCKRRVFSIIIAMLKLSTNLCNRGTIRRDCEGCDIAIITTVFPCQGKGICIDLNQRVMSTIAGVVSQLSCLGDRSAIDGKGFDPATPTSAIWI